MANRWKILFWMVMISILIGLFVFSLKQLQPKRTLPIINPSQVNPMLVDPSFQRVGRGHRVGDFSLVDQRNNPVDSAVVDGHVRVVEFFFTTCPSICKIMTNELLRVQEHYLHENQLLILSHTVMPEVDDVATLAAYAEEKGINYDRWRLLTGDKKEIYRLAREVYFIAPEPPEEIGVIDEDHDFIHTENIGLIDQQGKIRGYYDGTDEEEMNQLIEDIGILLQ